MSQAGGFSVMYTFFANARRLGDNFLARKIGLFAEKNKLPYYHGDCLNSVKLKRDPAQKTSISNILNKAFSKVENLVQDKVVCGRNFELLTDLKGIYKAEAEKMFDDKNIPFKDAYLYRLSKKIKERFKNQVEIKSINNNRQFQIVVPEGSNLAILPPEQLGEEYFCDKAAEILRLKCLNVKVEKLPPDLTTKDIIRGECPEIDPMVPKFFQKVLCGNNSRANHNANNLRKAQFMSEDLIYNVHRGRVKPARQLTTGIVLNNLTSSRKIVTIANKLGVSCSYNVVEGVQTAMAYNISKSGRVCPPEILLRDDRKVVVAFDNFDRFVDSKKCAGKETLHDTVGIIAQITLPSDPDYPLAEEDAIEIGKPVGRNYFLASNSSSEDSTDSESDSDSEVCSEEFEDPQEKNELDVSGDFDESGNHENEGGIDSSHDVYESNRMHNYDNTSHVAEINQNYVTDGVRIEKSGEITYPAIDKNGRFHRRYEFVQDVVEEEILRPLQINKHYLSRRRKIIYYDIPDHMAEIHTLDRLWILSHYCFIKTTPAWVGFNCKIYSDYVPIRRIGYLKSLNEPPTKISVIKKPLIQACKFKKSLGKSISK